MGDSLLGQLGLDIQDRETAEALEDAKDRHDLIALLVSFRGATSQTEIARRMGTTQSAVSDFERLGARHQYETMQRYARAVGARLRTFPVFEAPQVTLVCDEDSDNITYGDFEPLARVRS